MVLAASPAATALPAGTMRSGGVAARMSMSSRIAKTLYFSLWRGFYAETAKSQSKRPVRSGYRGRRGWCNPRSCEITTSW